MFVLLVLLIRTKQSPVSHYWYNFICQYFERTSPILMQDPTGYHQLVGTGPSVEAVTASIILHTTQQFEGRIRRCNHSRLFVVCVCSCVGLCGAIVYIFDNWLIQRLTHCQGKGPTYVSLWFHFCGAGNVLLYLSLLWELMELINIYQNDYCP